MDTTEDLRGIAQDKDRLASRSASPCGDFEAYSPGRDFFCLGCLWDKEDHPQFHAEEREGA